MRSPEPRSRRRERRLGRATASLSASALAAAFLVTCAPRTGTSKGSAPPLPVSGPRLVAPSGATFSLELARTDEERAQGLMFREFLAPSAGMVFLFEGLEIRPFWMKNCHFPIDIVYTKGDGTVVDVLPSVPACAGDPCPTYPPREKADTVVEINAGLASKNGIVPGARLRFLDVPGR